MGLFWKKDKKPQTETKQESKSQPEENRKDMEEQEWDLDFLTPYEKSSINVVFEVAEAMAKKDRRWGSGALSAIRQAKQHYLGDMGRGEYVGYTKEDIVVISMWLNITIEMLKEQTALIPGSEEILETLNRVKQKFTEEKIYENVTGKELSSRLAAALNLDFLTSAEKMAVRTAIETYYGVVKDEDTKETLRITKKHCTEDKDYTVEDIKMILLALGTFRKILEKVSFPGGAEGEALKHLPGLAETAEAKIMRRFIP